MSTTEPPVIPKINVKVPSTQNYQAAQIRTNWKTIRTRLESIESIVGGGDVPIILTGMVLLDSLIHRLEIVVLEATTTASNQLLTDPGYPMDEFRSLKADIQITAGNDCQFVSLILTYNGDDPVFTTFGSVEDNGELALFTPDVNADGNGLLRLRVTPLQANTTFKATLSVFKL